MNEKQPLLNTSSSFSLDADDNGNKKQWSGNRYFITNN
jgi:hypothetical protein